MRQRCPACGQDTAEFDKQLHRWACQCGWTDRPSARRQARRRTIAYDETGLARRVNVSDEDW